MTTSRRDVLKAGLACLGTNLGLPLAAAAESIMRGATRAARDVVSGDFEMYTTSWKKGSLRARADVPPANGWMYINNTFGRGSLVNGRDFSCTMTASQESFPAGALIEWDFRNGGGDDIGAFAYGYPAMMYGANPWGNDFNPKGPWPQRISDCTKLTVDYDVAIGGNTDSFNLLIDLYATEAPDSIDGSSVGEMSFFPFANPKLPFVSDGELMTLSFGECWVGIQGRQMCFQPSSGGGWYRRPILKGKIDLLEIFKVCLAKGWVRPGNYLRGAEFGAEVQVPASYNSAPHKGSLLFRKAPVFEWL